MCIESCRLAVGAGVQWAQITGSAVATNRIARAVSCRAADGSSSFQLHFRAFFHLLLADYKRDGRPVFPERFHDGGDRISSYVARIEDLKLDCGI